MTLILNLYEGTRQVKIMGWHGSAQSLGGVVWPMAGGALGALSWHMPFAVHLVAIPIGIVAAMGIPGGTAHSGQTAPATDTTVLRILQDKPVLFIICSLMFYINFQSNFRGRFSSYLLMIAFVAQFAAPILFAPVTAGFGLRAVFFTGTCSSLLWLAVLIFYKKQMASRVQ
jgi:MFS family permease